MDKLRILLISRQYPPDMTWGGIGVYVSSMARALAGRGHEVHVLSCVEDQPEKDYEEDGVFVHLRPGRMPFRRTWGLVKGAASATLRVPRTLWRFEKGIEVFFEYRRLGLDFDVIEYPDWGALGCVLAFMKKKPLVVFIHTPPPSAYGIAMTRDMSWAWSLVYYSCRHANATTLSSLFHVQSLKQDGWAFGEDISIVPNAIDWGRWAKTRSVSDTPPVALFIGRLEEIKAPEVLVAAMSIVRKRIPDARAVFVGEITERDGLPYTEWIKETVGNTRGCDFVGEVPRQQVVSYLSSSRVMVMPSLFDVYPMAALEAMAAGRPVVITKTTGVAEQIERTGGGKVVLPGDPQALADALLPFLSDSNYASDAGNRGQSAVRKLNDIGKIAADRETVYLRAIRRFQGQVTA